MNGSPFHVGEQRVQSMLGIRDSIEPWARRVVRNHLPEQHREFHSKLPFMVAGARDTHGRPWATLLAGSPGFVQSPDDKQLVIDTRPLPGDALEASVAPGTELGLLGIELDSRRRNRVNGTVTATGDAGIRLDVRQTFGNCPQYITARSWYQVEIDHDSARSSRHAEFDASMRDWLAAADTFFVASGYRGQGDSEAFGMDVSHRGGAPGFVKVESRTRLVFPDYAGNNHFNTIGNLVMDPRVGLLFVDFDQGSILQLTGEATIDWDSAHIAQYPGALRLVSIDIDEIVRLDHVLPLRWSAPRGSIRSLRVVRRTRESEDVVSLELAARDGGDLPDFRAGQHLPIELHVDGASHPVRRTYSLSNAPGQGRYRISVKREANGLVSNLLHDAVKEGTVISAQAPAGDFVLERVERPVVLIGAGIGVTPLVSMLHRLAVDPGDPPVVFVHGVRDGAHHPFAGEVAGIAKRHSNVRVHFPYSRPRDVDRHGSDYDQKGRITAASIEQLTAGLDADYYLCGPAGFLADTMAALDALGIEPTRIRTEIFNGVTSRQKSVGKAARTSRRNGYTARVHGGLPS